MTLIRFSVCPHDTLKGKERWESFAKRLEEILKEKVIFEPIPDFKKEFEYIEKGDLHLYYVSPHSLRRALDRGYKPVAKIKNQKDRYFLLTRGELPPEGEILVALPFLEAAGYALLGIDIERVKLVFVKDYEEALSLLKEGKVHASVMYNETWEEIDEKEKANLQIVESYIFESSHIFLGQPQLYDKLKDALLSLENIEEVKEEDIKKTLRLYDEFDRLLKLWSHLNIAKALEKSPQIGILIYKDKIVYANESACNMIGYKREELIGRHVLEVAEDLITESHRRIIKEALERALQDEKAPSFYGEVPFLRRDGNTLWALTFADGILYQGDYHRIALFIDITQRKRLERLYSLLRKINRVITKSLLEEELFESTCKALVEEMGLKFVWVGVPDLEGEKIKPAYHYGYEEGYLKELNISTREDLPSGRGPTGTAYRENRIMINPDTRALEEAAPWKGEMLKRGYLSSTAIPIRKGGKVAYILNLYAPEPLFFAEENREVLEEIKEDLEFALNRIEDMKQNIITLKALENSSWILITDEGGKILYSNEGVSRISGYTKEELLGKKPSIFKSGYHSREFYEELWKTLLSGKTWHGKFINRRKDGQICHIEQTIYPIKLPDGSLRFVSVGLDVTKEVLLSSELEKLMLYDPLTGLLNAKSFYSKAEESLKGDKIFFLGIIDIHNFSSINGIYGIEIGDILLKEVGKKLKEEVEDKGIVSRIAADSFGILCGPLESEEDAIVLAEQIGRIFQSPFIVGKEQIPLSINMGITLYPKDGKGLKELLEKAGLALLEARRYGEGEIRFFEPTLERRIKDYLKAAELVEKAIKNGLFIFHYQPYFRTKDLSLAGVEALVRIKDFDGTLYSPKSFIDYLENSRYLSSFEEWAIKEIARRAQKWNIPVSINISAKTLKDEEFWDRFVKTCLRSPVNIEITERVFVESSKEILKLQEKLKICKNIRFTLDDFGTGYSSLAQITNLPVDLIKIDASFIRNLQENPKRKIIVKNVINLSKDLGIETLAEGVESQEELNLLKELDCTYVQGFLLSKPLPEEEIEKLLREKR